MCLKSSKTSLIQSKTESFCWSIRPCVVWLFDPRSPWPCAVWLLDLRSPFPCLSDFIPSLFPLPPHCSLKVLGTFSPWGPPLAVSSAGKSFPYLCPGSLFTSHKPLFSRHLLKEVNPDWPMQSAILHTYLACYTPHPLTLFSFLFLLL